MGEHRDSVADRVITCCWMPGFALRVLAHGRADLAGPVARASEGQAHPIVLDCTDAAREHGVEPGMLISRAMGCCSTLQVLGCDVPRVETAPSGDTQAHRLATQIEDEVIAMPNAPDCSQRAAME